MDLILRNARLPGIGPRELTSQDRARKDPARQYPARQDGLVDIGIAGGRIAAIEPGLPDAAPERDLGGALACGGLIESHIHLDKACVFDRTAPEPGRLADAIRRTNEVKRGFTVEDVHARASRVLARAVAQGTTRMRTHVELDPIVDLRGLEGVRRAVRDFASMIDVDICVFAEEGLTNNPGTDELLVAALESGIRTVGGAPGSDTDRPGQLRRVFELARRYDADIDLHIDFGNVPDDMDIDLVCRLTDQDHMGGRVAVAHMTKLTTHPLEDQRLVARRLADTGITLAVLPATDLFLMGRDQTSNVRRGVVNANMLIEEGANAVLGSNNILNAFTPFGDCSLLRLANFYAHVAQVSSDAQMGDCWDMLTKRAARMLNCKDYGLAVGNPADIVVLDAETPVQAIREIRQPLLAYKRGRQTLEWARPELTMR
jgi:cytosine deaminase